jgi:hypothetical protein
MTLSNIACQSAAPTKKNKQRVDQFLDCMWAHPNAKICYRVSDMVLNVHSDTLYPRPPRPEVMPADIFPLAAFPSTVTPSN